MLLVYGDLAASTKDVTDCETSLCAVEHVQVDPSTIDGGDCRGWQKSSLSAAVHTDLAYDDGEEITG